MKYIVDTHVLTWRLLQPSRLSKNIQRIFSRDGNQFLIPTMVIMEMQYLQEIGRIQIDMNEVLSTLQEQLSFQLMPFDEMALLHALHLTGTRDPFDRVILAQALATSTKLLTKDRWMKRTAPHLVVE